MKLIICEKASVGAAIAAALGISKRKNDTLRELTILCPGVSNIWWGLPTQMYERNLAALRIHRHL